MCESGRLCLDNDHPVLGVDLYLSSLLFRDQSALFVCQIDSHRVVRFLSLKSSTVLLAVENRTGACQSTLNCKTASP